MDKKKIAKKLVKYHTSVEDSISLVQIVTSKTENDENEPIKLIEVNKDTVPSGVMPVNFTASGDITCSSTIIEVTPNEYLKIKKEELDLPYGWKLGEIIYKKQA